MSKLKATPGECKYLHEQKNFCTLVVDVVNKVNYFYSAQQHSCGKWSSTLHTHLAADICDDVHTSLGNRGHMLLCWVILWFPLEINHHLWQQDTFAHHGEAKAEMLGMSASWGERYNIRIMNVDLERAKVYLNRVIRCFVMYYTYWYGRVRPIPTYRVCKFYDKTWKLMLMVLFPITSTEHLVEMLAR